MSVATKTLGDLAHIMNGIKKPASCRPKNINKTIKANNGVIMTQKTKKV